MIKPKNNREAIIAIIILILWIIPQIYLKQYLYALLLALTVPVLFIKKKYLSKIIIAGVLVIGLFSTQIPYALSSIYSTFRTNVFVSRDIYTQIDTTGSGKSVLPEDVINILTLIDDHHLQSYGMSSGIQNNALDKQRIVESAWPVKFEKSSKEIFIFNDESSSYSTCKQLDQVGSVTLVECN